MNIIAVVGPSGAGKDTLLRRAGHELADDDDIVFLRRYITRRPDTSEDNYYLDDYTFGFLHRQSFFVSTWQAHHNLYGIARHSFEPVRPQTTYICSISRGAVADFDAFSADTVTVEISVRPEILAERLLARGRENKEDIDRRLARADRHYAARRLIRFDNSAPLEHSSHLFLRLLRSLHKAKRTLLPETPAAQVKP